MPPIRLTMPSTVFILPKGTYTLTVTGTRVVDDTDNEQTLPAIQVYFATAGNAEVPDGVAVYCRLYTRPDCLWKIATFHKAAGLEVPIGDCEIDLESWAGLTLKARVEPRESAGQTFNVVERFCVPKKGKPRAADTPDST